MTAKNKAENKTEKIEELKFTKGQILESNKYKHRKDVLSVVLEYGRDYSLKEVDDLIDKFMKEVN